ncbi:hypothetical protein BSKO_04156 [Bryopsis sp. KO-2023]|nr:hypothetical protein BSKO_04156 [Bryopsis sp. KO-2023]
MSQPWVEKYRPRSLDQIVSQELLVEALRTAVETKNVPHFLFYGPPGTGKTTAALVAARELFGPSYKNHILELNASSERGIDVVRHKINNFAKLSAKGGDVGYRLIILDEADNMTKNAQACLNRVMETASARFFILCNYVSKLIDPLVSRTIKFQFKPFTSEGMTARIKHICKCEGVKFADDGVMDTLRSVGGGDLRKTITTLQSAVRKEGNVVDSATLFDVSGRIPEDAISSLVSMARAGQFPSLASFEMDFQHLSGYGAEQLLSQLLAHVTSSPDIGELQKAKLALSISEALSETKGNTEDLCVAKYLGILAQELACGR